MNIERELAECRRSAEEGYKIADESFEELEKALHDEKENLRKADSQQNNINRLENDKHFRKQLEEISAMERDIINEVDKNLSDLKKRMSDFTIVLYGRTMAGKSTLMEILTHGDGSAIGKGSQRTTLDVRDYKWNGLRIFDVPGTCSFGGEEDDKLAYEAAKSADLALFLLTDDAPQPYEAERLAELKKLGKPVLGIVNVKQVLSPERDGAKRKLDLKKLERRISDTARLEEIVRQFKEFSQKSGHDFGDVPFVFSHLQSAFFSQPERENDRSLYEMSNFSAVENFIIEKFKEDGQFIRIKNFVDAVARPMQDSIFKLYGHSAESLEVFATYADKIEELDEWEGKFRESLKKRLENFFDGLSDSLDYQMNYVVNNYYESKSAGDEWKKAVNRVGITNEVQNFLNKIGEEATRKMRELSDELTQDLNYSGASVNLPRISMEEITDWQGGLMLVAPLLIFTPIGWGGAIAMALGSLFFGDSKEEKIRQSKRELREKLEKSRNEIIDKMIGDVGKIIDEEIFKKQIGGFRDILVTMVDMLVKLSYAQNKIAGAINNEYRELNYELLCNAIEYAGGRPRRFKNITTARVVGEEFPAFSTSAMPDAMQDRISQMLGEKFVMYPVGEENYWGDALGTFVRDYLDGNFNIKNFLDEEWGYMDLAHLPSYFKEKELDAEVHLTYQLFESPIVFSNDDGVSENTVDTENSSNKVYDEKYWQVFNEVRNIIAKRYLGHVGNIVPSNYLLYDLNLTVNDVSVILKEVERKFSVALSEDVAESITVDDIVRLTANFEWRD